MKKIILSSILVVSIFSSAFAGSLYMVNGYVKSNGTYVAPHLKTTPDNSLVNNLSYWK